MQVLVNSKSDSTLSEVSGQLQLISALILIQIGRVALAKLLIQNSGIKKKEGQNSKRERGRDRPHPWFSVASWQS